MVLSNNSKILVIIIFILIIVPSSLAWTLGDKFSCTPDPCPSSTYRGWQVSTQWDNSTFNTSLGGNCVKDGGTNGDYCVRTCNMAEGCYGNATSSFQGFASLEDQNCAYGSTGFVSFGATNLDTNNCYWIESVTVYDSDSSTLNYNWAHYYNATSPGIPFFLLLDGGNHGGTSSLTNTEYIYLYPFGYSIDPPSDPYDLIHTRYDKAYTEARLTPTSGCYAGDKYSIWAEEYAYSIPRVSNYQEQLRCIQNAEAPINQQTFAVSCPSCGSLFWDYTTGVKTITRPSDNQLYITMQWADDTQDNGNYSSTEHTPFVNLYIDSPEDEWPLEFVVENHTVDSYSCLGTVCSATAQFYINISHIPDGDIWFYTQIDDGFGEERAETGSNQYVGYVYKGTINSSNPPNVTLNSPTNGASYPPGSYINFNYTSISNTGTSVLNTIKVNNNPIFSANQINGTYNFTQQFNSVGTYTWKVIGTDSYGTTTSEERTFEIIDASFPSISSASVPTVNAGNNLVCQASIVSGTYPVDKVWCEINPQSTQKYMTFQGGSTYSGSILTSSSWATNQTWIIYVNDTKGNIVNKTGTTQINHVPSFVSQSTSPTSLTSYGPNKQYVFNSTWTDDIGLSQASITFTSGPLSGNTYSSVKTGNTFSRSFTGLDAGTYTYYWTVLDTGSLFNTSPSSNYVINKADPIIINSMDPSFTVPYGTTVTGSCTINNNTGGIMKYNKCELQTSSQKSTPGTISMTPVQPSVGSYVCNCTVSETSNWNSATNLTTLTIQSATVPLVSNLQPVNASIVDVGDVVGFNSTVTPGSYPVDTVLMDFNSGSITIGSMTGIGGDVYQRNVTLRDIWPTYLNYRVVATDQDSGTDSEQVIIINNHAPLFSNSSIDPNPGVPYSPSTTYTFNITATDDLDAVITQANITIDGTEYSATHVGGGKFSYQITGLSTAIHNYTWTAWDSRGVSRTTSLQQYPVGVTQTILQIFIEPSVSVIQGTQTTVNCTSNVPVNLSLYRNGALVSNPDVQTLSSGTYTYICNTTGGGNYSAGSTSDLLIVNPQNAQTQTQFCDGQFEKEYTYYNGSENYTMCINLPCNANFTSASINITPSPLHKLINRYIGMFVLDSISLSSCGTYGHSFLYNYRSQCNNSDIYSNNGRVEILNSRIINSTINNTIENLPVIYNNVIIKDAYILNGRLLSGTIRNNTQYDNYGISQNLYEITFDQ